MINETLLDSSKKIGLKISQEKIKYFHVSSQDAEQNHNIHVPKRGNVAIFRNHGNASRLHSRESFQQIKSEKCLLQFGYELSYLPISSAESERLNSVPAVT
jgi:hypothetical protein